MRLGPGDVEQCQLKASIVSITAGRLPQVE